LGSLLLTAGFETSVRTGLGAGLPDGIFLNQKSKFLEGLAMVDVGILYVWPFGLYYGHLGNFMNIWYNLCSFGALFGTIFQEKSGNSA
jgi:hypothetical protein